MCVCVCVCVCVSQLKKVADEWQARQTRPTKIQGSSSMHNPKKITTRARGPFHQSITAILTEEKEEKREVCVCVCEREREREREREKGER